jgi:hypothetical protein
MTARRTCTLAGLVIAGFLISSLLCWAESGRVNDLTVAEYRSELDRLSVATQQLDSSGRAVPATLRDLPQNWRVRTDPQAFEIPAEGLRRDVRRFEREPNLANASAIRSRIRDLRSDLDGFETSPPDVTASREHLAALLARPEFGDVRGPTFLDRLKQKLIDTILRLLDFLFHSSAIPTISRFFVYGLIGLAVLTLAFIAYRQIMSASQRESVVPTDLPVSARSWSLWLDGARAAAAQNNWREAIHLAYWAGISYLEQQGMWRPDRARTPREYLRLLSDTSEHRETLSALTRVFELTWYAKQKADAGTFSQMMQALERLGCHSS